MPEEGASTTALRSVLAEMAALESAVGESRAVVHAGLISQIEQVVEAGRQIAPGLPMLTSDAVGAYRGADRRFR